MLFFLLAVPNAACITVVHVNGKVTMTEDDQADLLEKVRFLKELNAKITESILMLRNDTLEEAYRIARGGEDRFKKHGANQMYWKGRSDAADEIRKLKEKP
jgi:hypothetical protein